MVLSTTDEKPKLTRKVVSDGGRGSVQRRLHRNSGSFRLRFQHGDPIRTDHVHDLTELLDALT